MDKYKTTTSVNLRSSTDVVPQSVILVLPQNTIVIKIRNADKPDWWLVSVPSVTGLKGFINSTLLVKIKSDNVPPPPPPAPKNLIEAHLVPSSFTKSTRSLTSGRHFQLKEKDMVKRTLSPASKKASSIGAVIDYLNSPASARYAPGGGNTFCNIYAADFAFLCKVYIPRVWWTASSLVQLSKGKTVEPVYATTVNELNANSLHDWFAEFGAQFGWTQVFDTDELQKLANKGNVCVIVGKRKNTELSGHIAMVVPETATAMATRKNDKVTVPLQSQAGATNFKYGGSNWWQNDKFRSFGFWVHD